MHSLEKIFISKSSIIKVCLLGAAYFVEQVGSYGLYIWIARGYGPLEYSYFTIALVLTKVVFGVTEMGLQPVVTRELAKKSLESAEIIHNTIVIRLITTLSTAVALNFVVHWMLYPDSIKVGVKIFSIYMVLLHVSNLNLAVLRGKELQNLMAFIMLSGSISTFLLASWLIMVRSDLRYVQMAFVLGAFIQTLFGYYHQKESFYSFKFNYSYCVEILKKSLPYGLVAISSFIYFRIDEVMISFFYPETDYVGIYDAAYTVFYATAFVPMILHHIFLPFFSRLHTNSLNILKKSYYQLMMIVLVYSILLCSGIFFFSEPMILIIYGNKYLDSVEVLQVLMIGGVFLSLSFTVITTLIAIDKGLILLRIVGFSAILNVALNIVAIPGYGYMGAAVTTIITETFLAIVGICYLKNYFLNRIRC
ncbi:MAG: flippase [Desulfobacter sp.]